MPIASSSNRSSVPAGSSWPSRSPAETTCGTAKRAIGSSAPKIERPRLRLSFSVLLRFGGFEQVGQRIPVARRQQARSRVREKLLARIGDVEVPHRQLSDPILRREGRLALFHGQPLGLIREVRTSRIEDGVVVPAAELESHLSRDRARHPALRGLTQHERLRIEPPALIQQTTKAPAVLAVLLDRVLVMNAGDETLVGDEQKSQDRKSVGRERR